MPSQHRSASGTATPSGTTPPPPHRRLLATALALSRLPVRKMVRKTLHSVSYYIASSCLWLTSHMNIWTAFSGEEKHLSFLLLYIPFFHPVFRSYSFSVLPSSPSLSLYLTLPPSSLHPTLPLPLPPSLYSS